MNSKIKINNTPMNREWFAKNRKQQVETYFKVKESIISFVEQIRIQLYDVPICLFPEPCKSNSTQNFGAYSIMTDDISDQELYSIQLGYDLDGKLYVYMDDFYSHHYTWEDTPNKFTFIIPLKYFYENDVDGYCQPILEKYEEYQKAKEETAVAKAKAFEEELEAKERAEYERLKEKYGNN